MHDCSLFNNSNKFITNGGGWSCLEGYKNRVCCEMMNSIAATCPDVCRQIYENTPKINEFVIPMFLTAGFLTTYVAVKLIRCCVMEANKKLVKLRRRDAELGGSEQNSFLQVQDTLGQPLSVQEQNSPSQNIKAKLIKITLRIIVPQVLATFLVLTGLEFVSNQSLTAERRIRACILSCNQIASQSYL